MGTNRSSRPHQDGGWPLIQAARVVPNVPSFSVDNGFWYSIPDHLADNVGVGSIVRVPLSGRRVRGWVVELADRQEGRLKPIAGVSGAQPVFTLGLLKTLNWAATHYVAPVSVLLAKATPPNLPKKTKAAKKIVAADTVCNHPLGGVATSVARGVRMPAQVLVGPWQKLDWVSCLTTLATTGRSVSIITASAAEVNRIADAARPHVGEAIVTVGGDDDASVTASWEQSQPPGRLIVGTPRIATWQIADLALTIVLEEGRRAMKDRQTPTLHVREIVRSRSLLEGVTSVFFGPTPSVELLASGAQVTKVGTRAWPLVEVIDRSEEAPGKGLLADSVIASLRGNRNRGGNSFVLTTHKMREPIEKEIIGRIGSQSGDAVQVGTERDLAGLGSVELTVAPNPDGMLLGRSYRGTEEALRLLARLANAVSPGTGHRMMVQTTAPDSDLIQTLRRGDPVPFLEKVLLERARAGVPPSTSMMAVEIRDKTPESVGESLAEMGSVSVLGPLDVEDGLRWLLDGDLRSARRELRPLVAKWREGGATVRIDADPIDI